MYLYIDKDGKVTQSIYLSTKRKKHLSLVVLINKDGKAAQMGPSGVWEKVPYYTGDADGQ